MKQHTLFLLTLFSLLLGNMWAQCPTGFNPFSFDTQGEIDAFATNYPNCTELPHLRIYEENGDEYDLISNLNGLSHVTSVAGDVSIEYVNIGNLSGLNNLTSVGGSFTVEEVGLVNLGGLENLTSIGGDFRFTSDDPYNHLQSLSGVENLTHIGGTFSISGIGANDFFPAVSTLEPLSNLTFIGGDVYFEDLDMSNLNGLENLTSIGGLLYIFGCDSLTNINALANLNSLGSLHFQANNNLSECAIQAVCDHISTNGYKYIDYNATGCDSVAEVEDACTSMSQCPPGDVTIASQAEMDAFAASYPNCTEINGDFVLTDPGPYNDIMINVPSLPALERIAGKLSIGTYTILSANSFTALNRIDGSVHLSAGMEGEFQALEYVGGSIVVFDGLNNGAGTTGVYPVLKYIGGSISAGGAEGGYLASSSFPLLERIEGGIFGCGWGATHDFSGFDNLRYIGGSIRTQQGTIAGMNMVDTIGGSLIFEDCYNYSIWVNITGLNQLKYIGGDLKFNDKHCLEDLSGLTQLNTVGGDFGITFQTNFACSTSMDNVTGLEQLQYVGDDLLLFESNLTNLDFLSQLVSVGDSLYIRSNSFDNLDALNHPVDVGGELIISQNWNLSDCAVQAVCDHIDANGITTISNNLSDCNSEEEVEAACTPTPICPTGNITLGSQQEIDDFPINNPDCTEIAGNVHIYSSEVNSDITNLDGLSQITSISGNLIITSNTNLSTIMGLSNLTTIGGYLYMVANSTLTSLAGLENLDFTTISDVTIRDNDALSICGLEGLCAYLENNGSATIFNNGPGCDSPAEVLLFCNPPDDIDMDFGTNGTIDIPGHDVSCMLTQPDDKLIVFGSSVLRLNPDGTLDTNFGTNGVASVGGFEGVLQPDGKIVVLAADQLARLNDDGTLDATFGMGGTRPLIAPAKDIALSPDGKIVTSDTELVRYNADGSVDTAFGDNGIVSIEVQAYHYGEYPGAPQVLKTYYPSSHVVVKSDGKIVVAGDFAYQSRYNPNYIIYYNRLRCLISYNADGTRDSNFNEWIEGWYQGDVFSYVGDLLLLPDDEFVMLSSTDFELEGNLCMNQYDANGTFIDSNCTYTSLCGDSYYYGALWSKATVADCGIFAFGEYGTIFGNTCKFLTRTDYDGTPFSGFGENGGVALPVVTDSETADIALQSDGGIIVAGNSATGIVLARLSNDEACNPLFLLTEPPSPPSDPCGGTPASIDSLTHIFDEDLFIDGVGFANNPTVTFTDPATPADAVLSDISLELYFRLNGNSCENEIAIQITDPAGNTQPLTAFTTCDGGTGLYYVNLDVPSGNTTGSVADWLVEFDDTNDQNTDYEYSVRFARLNYVATTGGSGETIVNEVSDFADSDLFIDGSGFGNNGNYTFTDPGTPANAVLSDISLELYFRLNGASCENEIALQITDPVGNTQPLTAYTTCDGGTGLFYVNLDVPSGNTTGSIADWIVQFDDTNDQNSGYEYSVRFGRLTYTTTHTEGGGGMAVTVNDEVSDFADADLFIDGVGFANNGNYTFTDSGTPANAILSNISLELYFRLNGNSCENEIAIQITDPAGNTQPLTAYTTCDGGTGLYYVNLDVPSGNTTGGVADWLVEFDDTNDQNSGYEYSVRFGRLTYDVEYTECVPMMVNEENTSAHQYINTSAQENVNSSTRQLNNSSLKLYPVPANHHLNVEYFSENTHPMNIEILSNEGKVLMSSQENLQEGMNTIQLDIADLPAGHYHIRMYGANDMQMQSFVKITL